MNQEEEVVQIIVTIPRQTARPAEAGKYLYLGIDSAISIQWGSQGM